MNRPPGGEAATLRLLELAGIAPPLKIIDLGAGDGETVRLLRSLGHRAVGIDLSPGPGVERGDILSPPFAPGSFDAAVSQCSLLLTGNVPAAFSAAHTLLRSCGVFMYSDVVPGGVPALKSLAAGVGFTLEAAEDITTAWREYYIAALWRGEVQPPPEGISGKNCRYVSAVMRKTQK